MRFEDLSYYLNYKAVYEAILRISFAAAPKNDTRLFSLYIGDRSTFFMRKDARDMTRKKICMPSTPCSALRRRKLSKSHPIDIRRVLANANCAALVELCVIDGLMLNCLPGYNIRWHGQEDILHHSFSTVGLKYLSVTLQF